VSDEAVKARLADKLSTSFGGKGLIGRADRRSTNQRGSQVLDELAEKSLEHRQFTTCCTGIKRWDSFQYI
jgi:hypothetical protein